MLFPWRWFGIICCLAKLIYQLLYQFLPSFYFPIFAPLPTLNFRSSYTPTHYSRPRIYLSSYNKNTHKFIKSANVTAFSYFIFYWYFYCSFFDSLAGEVPHSENSPWDAIISNFGLLGQLWIIHQAELIYSANHALNTVLLRFVDDY